MTLVMLDMICVMLVSSGRIFVILVIVDRIGVIFVFSGRSCAIMVFLCRICVMLVIAGILFFAFNDFCNFRSDL